MSHQWRGCWSVLGVKSQQEEAFRKALFPWEWWRWLAPSWGTDLCLWNDVTRCCGRSMSKQPELNRNLLISEYSSLVLMLQICGLLLLGFHDVTSPSAASACCGNQIFWLCCLFPVFKVCSEWITNMFCEAAGASSCNVQGKGETNIFAFAPSIYPTIVAAVLTAQKCNYLTCSRQP